MAGEEDWALYPEELAAAKAYMHVDDDDAMVVACVLAARGYLDHACGVSLPPPGTSRRAIYDIVCHALANDAYDRRSTVIVGASVNENPVFCRFKNHLKWTDPPVKVSDMDTLTGAGERSDRDGLDTS